MAFYGISERVSLARMQGVFVLFNFFLNQGREKKSMIASVGISRLDRIE